MPIRSKAKVTKTKPSKAMRAAAQRDITDINRESLVQTVEDSLKAAQTPYAPSISDLSTFTK